MDVQIGDSQKEITVDSAAEESVCPRGWATEWGIKPVDKANRMNFVSASGAPIEHYGQRDVVVKANSTF